MAKRSSSASSSQKKGSSGKSSTPTSNANDAKKQNKKKKENESDEEEEDICPSCVGKKEGQSPAAAKGAPTDWVGCEKCSAWHHWACVAQPQDRIELLAKWYCPDCLKTASSSSSKPLQIEWKDPVNKRKSSRSTTQSQQHINYGNLNEGFAPDPSRFHKLAQSKTLTPHNFNSMKGTELTAEWLWSDPHAMTQPILIESPKGLDLKVPQDPSVQGVADAVGHDMPVEVIDVASQSDLANWNMGTFAKYYDDPSRSKVRNVISLEVSKTPLGSQIIAPRAVRDMDWIQNIWPDKLRKQGVYPQVQKYCLMSVANCWTDWHVDFAASSVWYHICRGSKTFYFIRPTPENLHAYEKWSGSHERQENTWLGDHVDKVYMVELKAGNTMIIPTGWIHAVYTPSDSLVFGGNFLHSLNIATQLELYRIEIATRVPRKFRFPHFVKFLWYVSKHYYDRLLPLSPQPRQAIPSNQKPEALAEERLPQDVPPRVLQGLKALSVFLQGQARRLVKSDPEEFTFEQRRIAKENVPNEAIKSPIEHVKLFRALILRILGEADDAPTPVPALQLSSSNGAATPTSSQAERKRKAASDHASRSKPFQGPSTNPTSGKPGPAKGPESKQDVNTSVTHEVLRRPPREGSTEEGPEELAEIRIQTTVQEVSRIARGKDRVLQETRTKTEVLRRVIWSGVPPPPPQGSATATEESEARDDDVDMADASAAGQEREGPLPSALEVVMSAKDETLACTEGHSQEAPSAPGATDSQAVSLSATEDLSRVQASEAESGLPESDVQDAADIMSSVTNTAAEAA